MRAIIVDDEPPARNLIGEYLREDFPDIEVAAVCKNGREAIEAVNEQVPDLLFLDVQMPGLSGLDVLERIETLPHVIFSTAYDEYAIKAFDAGAVDYLLKPYSRARFQKAVRRAVERHRDDAPATAYADRVAQVLQTARSDDYPERLFVRHGDKIRPVATADIVYIEAAGDYSKLHTEDKTHLSNLGLGELEDRLDPSAFIRVHRSTIIALDALEHLVSDGSGGYRAVLAGQNRVRVSRTYASKIRDLLD